MESLTLTDKELQVLEELRAVEIRHAGDCFFVQEAWPKLKQQGMTRHAFASLIGHLESKGIFSYFVVGDDMSVAKGCTQYELTDEARLLIN